MQAFEAWATYVAVILDLEGDRANVEDAFNALSERERAAWAAVAELAQPEVQSAPSTPSAPSASLNVPSLPSV